MSETTRDRVLGAVQFIDAATRTPVRSQLELSSDRRVKWQRNPSGIHVAIRAAGLDAHSGHDPGLTDADMEALFLAPPPAPLDGPSRFTVTVDDPAKQFLPRSFDLPLPRPTADMFTPLAVPLYRSTAAPPLGTGARVFVFVHDGRGQKGALPGALVTVAPAGRNPSVATTGPNGEAVVELGSLPSFFTGEGEAVTSSEIDAVVGIAVDLSLLEEAPDESWALKTPPDPARFNVEGARTAMTTIKLSAGRVNKVTLPVALP